MSLKIVLVVVLILVLDSGGHFMNEDEDEAGFQLGSAMFIRDWLDRFMLTLVQAVLAK